MPIESCKAESLREVLDGYDDWRTYTENQAESIWSVSFAARDETLYFALVDIASDSILEAHQP